MSSLKSEMHSLCKEVASEFENWSFMDNQFKNKVLKHTDLIVSPGLTFFGGENPSCSLQPAVFVDNKKAAKLYKAIFGRDGIASFIQFQTARNLLKHYPENMRSQGRIWLFRQPHFEVGNGKEIPWHESWIGFDQARAAVKGLLMDGIQLLQTYYDVSSEENLLRNLPPKYVPAAGPNEEMEGGTGIMICLTRILLGDFNFVKYYASEDYKTLRPKRESELEKILEALPDLRRHYAETGSVI